MTLISENSANSAIGAGSAAVAGSLVSNIVGGAFAKQLFPVIGTHGVTALRIGLAAGVLLAVMRPWRRMPQRSHVPSLFAFGLTMGFMNVLIYQSFARIPIGIATAIETVGPLAVVLLSSKRATDYAWLTMAAVGLAMLLPIAGNTASLDWLGVAFAVGAGVAWALYIVVGKRVSATHGGDAAAWGTLASAIVFVPFGAANSNLSTLTLPLFGAAIVVAVLSSALPYLLEIAAMRRLPSHVFGIFLSTAPAVAAVAGLIMLNEHLTLQQWLAMFLIVAASAGCALTSTSPANTAPVTTAREPRTANSMGGLVELVP